MSRTWSKREVLGFLDRVEPVLARMDFFELLDVDVDADERAIQFAFHGMAGALHPDRHRRSLGAGQLERLTIVYARIAEAYRVLRDPAARSAYLQEAARLARERRDTDIDGHTRSAPRSEGATTTPPLGKTGPQALARPDNRSLRPTESVSREGAPTVGPPIGDALDEEAQLARISPKAQSLYRRAQAALRTGDRSSALLNLRMALAAHPTSTLLRDALTRIQGK